MKTETVEVEIPVIEGYRYVGRSTPRSGQYYLRADGNLAPSKFDFTGDVYFVYEKQESYRKADVRDIGKEIEVYSPGLGWNKRVYAGEHSVSKRPMCLDSYGELYEWQDTRVKE